MAFAVKLQACTGVPGHDATVDADFRGGEPQDTHQTVKLPGMSHGCELDPVDDSELLEYLAGAVLANKVLKRLTGNLPEHLEIRIMDSDGRV